jgi:hypothetical protein
MRLRVQIMRSCLSVRIFNLQNYWMDFDKVWFCYVLRILLDEYNCSMEDPVTSIGRVPRVVDGESHQL